MLYIKLAVCFIILNICTITAKAQWVNDFWDTQKNNVKINEIIAKKLDTIQLQCKAKGIEWPIQALYIRAFKQENMIELWVKDNNVPKYQYFNTYKVCSSNGKLGPKRKEGDKQVPEGFYYINEFNPNSNYHLSLGINYPNVSDRILADAVRPGGDIYIHGDCVSVGCLAINDAQIEDFYILGTVAKAMGQEYIPIHIFPTKFNTYKAKPVLQSLLQSNTDYAPFIQAMQRVFYYFEKDRTLPPILINNKGQYIVEPVDIPVLIEKEPIPTLQTGTIKKVNQHKVRTYADNEIAASANTMPSYEGGVQAYSKFLKSMSNELASYLNDEQKKAFVTTEFVINTDGTVSNVTILKGGNSIINDAIITLLERTKDWSPAVKDGKLVAFKMTQTIFVEK